MPQMIIHTTGDKRDEGCISLVGSAWCRPVAATAEKEEAEGAKAFPCASLVRAKAIDLDREQHTLKT